MIRAGDLRRQALSASDFIFKVGYDSNPAGWANGAATISILVRPGFGANGSDRVEIVWADGAIVKKWLQTPRARPTRLRWKEASPHVRASAQVRLRNRWRSYSTV